MLQLQRYARGFKVGFNVVGSPEEFLATGSSSNTAFVFGSPHHRLPFADGTFDTVLSMNILEHVQDVQVGWHCVCCNSNKPGVSRRQMRAKPHSPRSFCYDAGPAVWALVRTWTAC
jgi:Methyltransferase domain